MKAETLLNMYRGISTQKIKMESEQGLIEIPAVPEGTDNGLIPVGSLVKLRKHNRAPVNDFDSVWVVVNSWKCNNWNQYTLRKQGEKRPYGVGFKQEDIQLLKGVK